MRQFGGSLNLAEIKTWANKFKLKKKLFNMKLENGQNLQDYLKVFVKLFEELAIISDAMEEEERVIILLSSLPDRFSTLVTALEEHEKIPAWEVVTERLLNEERRQRGSLGTSDSSEKLLVSFKRNKKLIGRSLQKKLSVFLAPSLKKKNMRIQKESWSSVVQLGTELLLIDLGDGVGVMQTKNELLLEQSAYTKALLSRFVIDKAYSVATPVDVNGDLVTTSDEVEECDKDIPKCCT
ncbi:hypothetical protein FHG87_001290 [Trinorchestia longiramus]|nr:hypothetical protein FHG87_001290 [Trinorchestia longiramus]